MVLLLEPLNDLQLKEVAERFGFSLDNMEEEYGYVPQIFIFGDKGVGKTSFSFLLPGTKLVLSYDGNAKINKKKFVEIDPINKELIKIYDLKDPTDPKSGDATMSENIVNIGERIVEQTRFIISNYHPDWVVFDGVDELSQYCELYMRKSQGLKAFEGTANRNVWKERNFFLNQLVELAKANTRCGVAYVGFERIVDVDANGEIRRIAMPSWAAKIKSSTNIVVYVKRKIVDGVKRFYADVVSSKDDNILVDGKTYEFTGYVPIVNPLGTKEIPKVIEQPKVIIEAPKQPNNISMVSNNATNTQEPVKQTKPKNLFDDEEEVKSPSNGLFGD